MALPQTDAGTLLLPPPPPHLSSVLTEAGQHVGDHLLVSDFPLSAQSGMCPRSVPSAGLAPAAPR